MSNINDISAKHKHYNYFEVLVLILGAIQLDQKLSQIHILFL